MLLKAVLTASLVSLGVLLGGCDDVASSAAQAAPEAANVAAAQPEPNEATPSTVEGPSAESAVCQNPGAVYHLDGGDVTKGDLALRWASSPDGRGSSFESLGENARRTFFNREGTRHAIYAEALELGLDKDPGYLEKLRRWGYASLQAIYKRREIQEKNTPADDVLVQYLPLALPAVQVRIAVAPTMEGARELYERARGGEDLGKIASEVNTGPLKATGGLSDWLDTYQTKMLPTAVVQRFLEQPVGALLEPFYQDLGFMVVRIEGKRSAEQIRMDELKIQKPSLLNGLWTDAYAARLQALREAAKIVIHEEQVAAFSAGRLSDRSAVIVEIDGDAYRADEIFPPKFAVGKHGDESSQVRVRNFIEEALVAREALRLGLDGDPDFQKERAWAAREMLVDYLVSQTGVQVDEEPVSEAELKVYYDAHPDEFKRPETRSLSIIQVGSEADAVAVIGRLRAGEAFSDVARQASLHRESGEKGGAIGSYAVEALPPPVGQVAFGLAEGAFCDPAIRGDTPTGPTWLVVKVDAVSNAAVDPLERARNPTIEGRIRTQKRTKALADLAQRAKEKHGYEYCR